MGRGLRSLQCRNPASASLLPPTDRGLTPSEAAMALSICPRQGTRHRGGWLRAAHGELSWWGERPGETTLSSELL